MEEENRLARAEEIWRIRIEERDEAILRARKAIESAEYKAPQAAGRLVNAVYRLQCKVDAAHLAMTAEKLTGEEREHLLFAARYLGGSEDWDLWR